MKRKIIPKIDKDFLDDVDSIFEEDFLADSDDMDQDFQMTASPPQQIKRRKKLEAYEPSSSKIINEEKIQTAHSSPETTTTFVSLEDFCKEQLPIFQNKIHRIFTDLTVSNSPNNSTSVDITKERKKIKSGKRGTQKVENTNNCSKGPVPQLNQQQLQKQGILSAWVEEHSDNPYPNPLQLEELMFQTGLTKEQLNVWFTNGAFGKESPREKDGNGFGMTSIDEKNSESGCFQSKSCSSLIREPTRSSSVISKIFP